MKNQARDFGFDRDIDFPTGAFSRSQSRQGSYDIGPLYPVYVAECLPGEHIRIGNTLNLAFTETLSAIRHEVNAVIDWYFVEYAALANITEAETAMIAIMSNTERLAYYDPRYGFRNAYWEKLITGGYGGNNVDTIRGVIPTADDLTPGSLWDHMGLPMTIDPADYTANTINAALFNAYNAIWNWNYRDENWQPAVNATAATVTVAGDPSESIAAYNRNLKLTDWEKDYFTTALRDQQRGPAQAVDVEGIANAIYLNAAQGALVSGAGTLQWPAASAGGGGSFLYNSGQNPSDANTKTALEKGTTTLTNLNVEIPAENLNDNTLNITSLGIDIAKLRTSIATQRVLERNARAGARDSEFYRAHFKTGPTDKRGDRPQFLGRFKQPIIFSDVTNTAVNGTPSPSTAPTIATQTMGHRQSRGDASGQGHVGDFHVKEYGILMAVMTIRPRPMYYQKTEKYWFAGRGRWDFPLPEFANLSEQPVYARELAPATIASQGQIFGYQGRYDEYRQKVNDAVGLLRPTGATGSNANLRSWNFGRQFSGVPVQGDTFLKVDPTLIKGANFVYTGSEIPMLIGTIGNLVEVTNSPLPQIAQPGLMDHI